MGFGFVAQGAICDFGDMEYQLMTKIIRSKRQRSFLPIGVSVNANNTITSLGRNKAHFREAAFFIHEKFSITWNRFGLLVQRCENNEK